MRRLSALVLVVVGLVASSETMGCSRAREEADAGAPVVDTELMAFLSEARALHHQADLKEEAGDIAGAATAMERLAAARRPHDVPGAKPLPEVEEVLADAYARLAELDLRRGDLARAADAIRSGLAHAPEPTYFRGHLLEVEGLIEKARFAALSDAGKTDEAARAREKALRVLDEAIQIQAQVIERSLANATKEAGR